VTIAKELGVSGLTRAVSAEDLGALAKVVYKTKGMAEAEGVAFAYVSMSQRGYKLLGDMIYNKSGHGLDLVFEEVTKSGQAGKIAVVEAKHSDTLGSLGEAAGARQGSRNYIKYQIDEYAKLPDANQGLVANMRAQLRSGDLESYAALYRADRLAQFDLQTFIKGGNLNANKYFIHKNVLRP
jgi:hypothetical protein